VITIPYKSAKQRAYLHSQKPEVAAKFDRDIKKTKKKAAKKVAVRRKK
jgi:hypothetical protein